MFEGRIRRLDLRLTKNFELAQPDSPAGESRRLQRAELERDPEHQHHVRRELADADADSGSAHSPVQRPVDVLAQPARGQGDLRSAPPPPGSRTESEVTGRVARRRTLVARVALSLLAAALLGAAGSAAIQPGPTRSRTIVVISDLHMGVGQRSPGQWHPYEDFRWSPEFAAFLDASQRRRRRRRRSRVERRHASNCCSRVRCRAALRRTSAAAKPRRAAGSIACSPHTTRTSRRSDASRGSDRTASCSCLAIMMPRSCSRGWAAASSTRSRHRRAGSRLPPRDAGCRRMAASPSEHGHQIGSSVDALEGWPAPFVRRDGIAYLARSASGRRHTEPLQPLRRTLSHHRQPGRGRNRRQVRAGGSRRRRRRGRWCLAWRAPSSWSRPGSSFEWSSTMVRSSRRCGTSPR